MEAAPEAEFDEYAAHVAWARAQWWAPTRPTALCEGCGARKQAKHSCPPRRNCCGAPDDHRPHRFGCETAWQNRRRPYDELGADDLRTLRYALLDLIPDSCTGLRHAFVERHGVPPATASQDLYAIVAEVACNQEARP